MFGPLRLVAWSGLPLLAACAGLPKAPASGPSTDAPEVRAQREFADLAARVAEARGLRQTRPTPVQVHDEASFHRALGAAAEHNGLPPTLVDSPAFQLAFGLAVLAKESTPPFGVTQRQQTVAFYDPVEHRIHARRSGLGVEDRESRDLVLAHELGHSLQHQHFALPEYRSMTSEDERVAQLAVLEGDAMLTMLAYVSSRNHVPLSRSLVRMREQSTQALARFDDASGVGEQRENMPTMHRERLMFPYFSGLNFVGELYRAGGYELVNRVYAAPPTTTEQILHPERYLAGESALRVSAPPAPAPYTSLAEGSVGELWTRMTLAVCTDERAAASAAAGWGGDAYRILQTPDGLGALIWSTAWDDEDEARQFEAASKELAKCWERAQLSGGSVFAGPPLVRRAGSRVVLVRGLPPRLAQDEARRALESPVERPRSIRPHGAVTLRAARPAQPFAASRVEGGVLSAPKLGFVSAAPAGFEVTLGELVTLRKGAPLRAQIIASTMEQQIDDETLRELYTGFIDNLDEELADDLEVEVTRRAVETAFGTAVLRRWKSSDEQGTVDLLAIPLCANTGALLIMTFSSDAAAQADVEAWFRTLKPAPRSDAGICAVLDP